MDECDRLSRRSFLQSLSVAAAGAAARAAGAEQTPGSQPAADDPDLKAIPTSPLGKTGVHVPRLGMGASFPEYGPRLLSHAFRNGVRYFDNSEWYLGYKSEGLLGEWVNRIGRRDDVFVVTKTKARTPDLVYQRVLASLDRLKLDTIDLFFLHALDQPEIPLDAGGEWRRLKDRLIREKRVRFMGFSTHAEMSVRAACLQNAVKGGWVDALMVACDPGLIAAHADFNRAVDACTKAGVGLVAMKTTRGLGRATNQPARALDTFKALGLGPHHAMQAGIWSDGRFAVVCSEMPNMQIIDENTAHARAFARPFNADEMKILHEGIRSLARATCPGCDGSCRNAAGTRTDFCSIARYLCYYEHDGNRDAARELYAALPPEARDWTGADLAAASRACHGRLDFEAVLERAKRFLA